MTDDGRSEMDLPLAAPVGDPDLRPPKRPYAFHRDPLIWSAGAMVAVAVSVGGWVFLNGEEEGGRPTARLAVSVDTETRSEDIALPLDSDGTALDGAWADASLNLASPGRDRVLSLSSTLDPALAEESVYGILPRVAADGRRPMDVYARPTVRFAGRTRSQVAVVLTGLGLSDKGTQATIDAMPGGVTLAFVPYADGVADWAMQARQNGHETL
ncbi:MAG: divergent polysaccharide deacetylase family protein, partial [Pseudomonadota bacterium]